MKSGLHWINLAGVVVLAVVCGFQWQRDRQLNLEINHLEQIRLAQEQDLAEQKRLVHSLTEDLDQMKQQFIQSKTDLARIDAELTGVRGLNLQLANERDHLKVTVTNWANAVTERDELLEKSNERIRALALDLNESIQKFNQLATNYNESIGKYNELATNYNAVVQRLKGQ